MNTQSPMTLDEKLWAAEAESKRLAQENERLRELLARATGYEPQLDTEIRSALAVHSRLS